MSDVPEGAANDSRVDDSGLLDTNAVILMSRLSDPSCLPRFPEITTITLAELSVGPHVADDEKERAARQMHLQQAEADFEPVPFDAAAARTLGQVASDLRRAGRKGKARAYDALIASVAISRGLPLYTANPGDFKGTTDLDVVEIPVPDSRGRARTIKVRDVTTSFDSIGRHLCRVRRSPAPPCP